MTQTVNSNTAGFDSVGTAQLDTTGKQVSFFEFWPTWLMYLPVAGLWLLLALRHRSFTLPLVANPVLPLSGMVGAAKSHVFRHFNGLERSWLLPWLKHTVTAGSREGQAQLLAELMRQKAIAFPAVAKPELGCRGAGVKLLVNAQDLHSYLEGFPQGADLLIQKLASWEPEAGVFYIRYPGEPTGRILSLTFKYTPFVIGDGVSTLRQLIEADPRAGLVSHLYLTRLEQQLDTIVDVDQPFRLLFSASHCRGAVFRDAAEHITPELTGKLDEILGGIPEFYYGRLDIKFRSVESLRRGDDLEIVEINGASSESINIWDRKTRLPDAIKMLLTQYRHLFAIGAINRQRGHVPPGIMAFWRAWRREKQLTARYPAND